MTRLTVVRIWWDGPPVNAYRVSFPYNKELSELLSNKIPISDRSFDGASKTWVIVERQLPLVQTLLNFVRAQVKLTSRADAEAHQAQSRQYANPGASTSRAPIDTAIIEFVRLTPFDAMLRAYRQAQMTLHPDKGGDPDKSARLNAAWDRVRKEVYNQ
jgi:hypothetical protein